jgi:hypothetical protein
MYKVDRYIMADMPKLGSWIPKSISQNPRNINLFFASLLIEEKTIPQKVDWK